MSKVIRAILTLALVYGAYTETGIFTALSLLLIFVALEAQGWLTKRALDAAKSPVKELLETAYRLSNPPRK